MLIPLQNRKLSKNIWIKKIDAIENEYLKSGDYRSGCFFIRDILKDFIAERKQIPTDSLTLRDIQKIKKLRGTNVEQFFKISTPILFARREPSESDFLNLVAEAKAMISKGIVRIRKAK